MHNISKDNKALIPLFSSLIDSFLSFLNGTQNNDIKTKSAIFNLLTDARTLNYPSWHQISQKN